MTQALAHLHEDIEEIKQDVALIKHLLSEKYELSDEAKESLLSARQRSRSTYISHEELKKRLLK